MDISVLTSMKNAANCDTSCELQSSVNHQIFERTRRSWVLPKSTFSSVSICSISTACLSVTCSWKLSCLLFEKEGVTLNSLSIFSLNQKLLIVLRKESYDCSKKLSNPSSFLLLFGLNTIEEREEGDEVSAARRSDGD